MSETDGKTPEQTSLLSLADQARVHRAIAKMIEVEQELEGFDEQERMAGLMRRSLYDLLGMRKHDYASDFMEAAGEDSG